MPHLNQVNEIAERTTAETKKRHTFQSLEILRAICALVVFGNHLFSKVDGVHVPLVASMIFNYATEAVICFFVLSGCVIALQNYPGINVYLKARAVRILPTYYLSLAFTVYVMFLAGHHIGAKEVAGNSFFLQTLQGDIVSPLSFDVPLWSLSYEVFYYLLFILILWKPHSLKIALTGSILLGASTYILPSRVGVFTFIVRIGSLFCIWLFGVIAVRFFRRGITLSTRDAILILAMGFCLSRVWISNDFYDFFRLFMFGIGCAALCSSLLGEEARSAHWFSVTAKMMPISVRVWLAITVGTTFLFASRSFLSTKVALLIGLAAVTIAPDLIVKGFKGAIAPIAPLLSSVGKLSFALYVVHHPMIELVNLGHWMTATERIAVAATASILLAYVLDRVVQRRIKHWVTRRSTLATT